MTDYDNNLRGVLFKNDKKATDKHPDYKGSCEIEGQEYWLSAWVRESKSGSKFLSLSFTVKEAQQATYTAPEVSRGSLDDDSIPF